jgi:hypothetical protein
VWRSATRGDVHDVAAAFSWSKEHLGGGDGAEEVDVDHLLVVVPLRGAERPEEHDTGVVDEDVGASISRRTRSAAATSAERSVTSASIAIEPLSSSFASAVIRSVLAEVPDETR